MLDVYFEIKGENRNTGESGLYNVRRRLWIVGEELSNYKGYGTQLDFEATAIQAIPDAAADRDMRDVRIEKVEVDLGEEVVH